MLSAQQNSKRVPNEPRLARRSCGILQRKLLNLNLFLHGVAEKLSIFVDVVLIATNLHMLAMRMRLV